MTRISFFWFAALMIVFVTNAHRLMRPTFLGDDVIRIIDARSLPLREQMFRPFSEHVAPGFELATAAILRPLGDRIDLLPAALTWFAFVSWLAMLGAASWWSARITGRAEVARLVFVILGVSSACIEVPWWFSAATYSLAAGCIFAVLAVIAGPKPPGIARCCFICVGVVMAMSFSAIGLLGVILGGLASVSRYGRSKVAGLDLVALSTGFAISWAIARVMGGNVVETASTRLSLAGFSYALAVPGGVALPLFLGIDAHAVTARFSIITGAAITIMLVLIILRTRISKPLRGDLAGMAFLPYLSIYPTRAVLVESGAWSEPDFLYFWTSRYHLFMIAVLAVATSIAIARLIEFLESRRVRMAWLVAFAIVVVVAFSQVRNANRMRHFENQPDQATTLKVLAKLRKVADTERISMKRLERILPSVRRGWNASVLELRPDCFPLVRLIDRRSDFDRDEHAGLTDAALRRKVIEKLGLQEWRTLNAHRWMNLDPADDVDLTGFREIEPVEMSLEKSLHVAPLGWVVREDFGHVEFSIMGLGPSSCVMFENIQAEGSVTIQWTTDDTWDDFRIAEYDPMPSANCPVPKRIMIRGTDFESETPIEHIPSAVRFRIKSTRAGALRIGRIWVGQTDR